MPACKQEDQSQNRQEDQPQNIQEASQNKQDQPQKLKELPREEKIAHAMRQIGEAWQKATDERYPLVRNCGSNMYGIWYLEQATIEFDVSRTNQLLSPYEGAVKIDAIVNHNEMSPKANAAKTVGGRLRGFKTVDQALNATTPRDLENWSGEPNRKTELIALYKVTEDAITLDRSNDEFRRMFCDLLQEYNLKLWKPVFTQPIK
jgi:hypothetical protein